jgi:hypothetical protein
MTEKALGAILNETVLAAGRKGLYVAFSLRDSFPNEWWQLSDTGSTSTCPTWRGRTTRRCWR